MIYSNLNSSSLLFTLPLLLLISFTPPQPLYLSSPLLQYLLLLFLILPLLLFHSTSSLAALASSCRHSEQTQHTSQHQGHTIGLRVCMCMCVSGAVVTVGPHRVSVAYCDIFWAPMHIFVLIHWNVKSNITVAASGPSISSVKEWKCRTHLWQSSIYNSSSYVKEQPHAINYCATKTRSGHMQLWLWSCW